MLRSLRRLLPSRLWASGHPQLSEVYQMNESLLLSLFPPEVQIGRRLTTLLRNFSGSRDLRVARRQRECLSQRPLSDTQTNEQVCSASMIDSDVNTFTPPYTT